MWWFENDRKIKSESYDEYDDVVFHIAMESRNYFETHNVPNYYIYCNDSIFQIVKGSELDPFSIRRFHPQSGKRNVFLNYIPEELETAIDFNKLCQIIEGVYEWPREQLVEIKKVMDNDMDMGFISNEVSIREYNLKKDIGDVWSAYQCGVHTIPIDILNTKDWNDISNIPVILDKLYDLKGIEHYPFVFAYRDNELLGYFQIIDLETQYIFTSLLLLGANRFIYVLYEDNSLIQLDDSDYLCGITLKKVAGYFNISFADYIIINKEKYRSVMEDIIEITRKKLRVEEYYSKNYYFNLNKKEIIWKKRKGEKVCKVG